MVDQWACEVVRWDSMMIPNLEKTPTSFEVDVKKTPRTVRWDSMMIPNLEKTPTSCEVDDKNSTNRLVCVVNE